MRDIQKLHTNAFEQNAQEKQGGGVKKNDESDVHLLRRYKQSSYLLYFIFILLSIFFNALFWRFVTRGVQKHGKKKHEKIHLGSSPNVFFFSSVPRPPPPRLFGSIFFNRVFGRFVTRGFQKRAKKNRAKTTSAPPRAKGQVRAKGQGEGERHVEKKRVGAKSRLVAGGRVPLGYIYNNIWQGLGSLAPVIG
jgi:hypothetical protein